MHWIKHITVPLLVLAAFAVAIATVFSDHAADYGTVSLPQGGVVELPSGSVKVFYKEGDAAPAATTQLAAPLSFEVTPAGGGAPLEETPTTNSRGCAPLFWRRMRFVGHLAVRVRRAPPSALDKRKAA